jgi:hypothetical protein
MIAQKTSLGVVGFGRGTFTLPNAGGRAALDAVGATPSVVGSADGDSGPVVRGGAAVGCKRAGPATDADVDADVDVDVDVDADADADADADDAGPRSRTMYCRNGSGKRLPIASETAPTAKANGQRDSTSSGGSAAASNSLPLMVISPGGGDATGSVAITGPITGPRATGATAIGRGANAGSGIARPVPPRAVDGGSSPIGSGAGGGGTAGGALRAEVTAGGPSPGGRSAVSMRTVPPRAPAGGGFTLAAIRAIVSSSSSSSSIGKGRPRADRSCTRRLAAVIGSGGSKSPSSIASPRRRRAVCPPTVRGGDIVFCAPLGGRLDVGVSAAFGMSAGSLLTGVPAGAVLRPGLARARFGRARPEAAGRSSSFVMLG